MNHNSLELLAPAGDLKTLKTVISAGADAVYFGGNLFGARAFAHNFSYEDAEEGIRYAHLFGKKTYLTVNTLLKNTEIERELYEYLRHYNDFGLDAVLVQDLGVLDMIRDCFPNIDLHASTQMSVSTKYGAKYLKKLGVKRVVAARELSLRELHSLHFDANMEVEAFLHGALCVSYSGQCYMSSILGGRSGNRGRCAQPCRLPYSVSGKEAFYLSPKDMSGLHRIPDLAENGVFSYKIEGRMKSTAYADAVTSLYRKYIDLYLEEGRSGYKVSKEDDELLLRSGSRTGFTSLYLDFHNGPEMMAFHDSSHSADLNSIKLHEEKKLPITARVSAFVDHPLSMTIQDLDGNVLSSVEGAPCLRAKNHPTDEEAIRKQMMKTGNTDFILDKVLVYTDQNAFLPLSQLNQLRRDAIDGAIAYFLPKEDRASLPYRPVEKISALSNGKQNLEFHVLEAKQGEAILNCLKEDSVFDSYEIRLCLPADALMDDAKWENLEKRLDQLHISIMYCLPAVARKKNLEHMEDAVRTIGDKALYEASSVDGIGFLLAMGISADHIRPGQRLYAWNDRSSKFYEKEGFLGNTVPYELNRKELMHRDNAASILSLYEYLPMMIMANCTHKNTVGCDHKSGITRLKDRKGIEFYVRNDCSICMNTIYNSLPFSLLSVKNEFKSLHMAGYLLSFTIENVDEIKRIMKKLISCLKGEKVEQNDFTYGHFHRGVD